MSTFVLIHGAGDVGWYWHLVQAELCARGHDVVAPDLAADDEAAELTDYADTVIDAEGEVRGERAHPDFRAAEGFLVTDFDERRSRLPRAISVSSASNLCCQNARN